jgi:anti-sigma factor ChrR (cupin superfamily)
VRPGESRFSSPRLASELDEIYKRRKEAAAKAEAAKGKVLAAAATNSKRQGGLQKILGAETKKGVISPKGGHAMNKLRNFSGKTI